MSDGTPRRPIVHIEDISRAFAATLVAPREAVHNQIFNVGANEENYQVKELAEIVRQTVPDCSIEYFGQGGPDQRDYWVDFSKIARRLPEYKLKWNARKGVKELYSAYQQFGLQVADLETVRGYIRLRQLRHLLDSGALNDELRWVRVD
jgi:nucleoside-diphosphate-sugar epimerase